MYPEKHPDSGQNFQLHPPGGRGRGEGKGGWTDFPATVAGPAGFNSAPNRHWWNKEPAIYSNSLSIVFRIGYLKLTQVSVATSSGKAVKPDSLLMKLNQTRGCCTSFVVPCWLRVSVTLTVAPVAPVVLVAFCWMNMTVVIFQKLFIFYI